MLKTKEPENRDNNCQDNINIFTFSVHMDASTFKNNGLWKSRNPLDCKNLTEISTYQSNHKNSSWQKKKYHSSELAKLPATDIHSTHLPRNKKVVAPVFVTAFVNTYSWKVASDYSSLNYIDQMTFEN